ncbi:MULTISPECIES: GNAT family N-acetyltransferase [unclassified Sphingobacterium]|uniref:GNAT family N-acetyltransferase n=1 Tax=unclassified Sphingobacterium TaxID=2609468 RepID=UPI0025E1BBD3|nr:MULTISPECIES: N-acetyltransferase [unclassified Sphingobacterium]
MNIYIRQESVDDYQAVFDLIEQAFKYEEHSNHQEQFLVEKLRQSPEFIPELSLIAEVNNKPIGYILLTKIKIHNEEKKEDYPSLALAPIAVLPEFQGKGVGGRLIEEAHKIAAQLDFGSIILLGHASYYPRFGYVTMAEYGISMPFDVPDENCMLIELREKALAGLQGTVVYPEEFGIF